MRRAAMMLAALSFAAGCGSDPRVTRVYDGKIVEGRFVPPEAYASFLRGALAEEAGDLKGAIAAYAVAADADEDEPELQTRLGESRCKLDPKDPEADRAFALALKLDPASASALGGKARCMLARGRNDEAAQLARLAAAQDPSNVGLEALRLRADAPRGDAASRERAIALTLAHGENVVAWDALIVWGRSRRDAELLARGFEGLVRAAPSRSLEVERGAVALLEGGALPLARRVSATVADAPRELGVIGPRDATVARLAVDEALARGDRKAALARATRGHVPLAELAARALLLDQKELALALSTAVTDADPGASGAQMVRAALKGSVTKAPAQQATDQPPELCALVFADRLATGTSPEIARAWLARITRTPMAPHDPLAAPLAADLATRGVIRATD